MRWQGSHHEEPGPWSEGLRLYLQHRGEPRKYFGLGSALGAKPCLLVTQLSLWLCPVQSEG